MVQIANDFGHLGDIRLDVSYDHGIGARIRLNFSTGTQIALGDIEDFRSICIVQIDNACHHGLRLHHGIFGLRRFVFELGDVLQRVYPNKVPLAHLTKLVQLENEIESLIPGNTQQLQADLALDRLSNDHVVPAHVGNQSQHAGDVSVLEIE